MPFRFLSALVCLAAGTVSAQPAEVLDLPVDAETRTRAVGLYAVSAPDGGAPLSLRIEARGAGLVGSIQGNDPTRLLYQGSLTFRPEADPAFEIRLGTDPDVIIVSPGGEMTGTRVGAPGADLATAGPLFDALREADRALFEAIFVACDADAAVAMLDADVEFYHDKGGRTTGEAVHTAVGTQATECPRARGMTREVVEGSLVVSPIPGFGAVQTGTHRFAEPGGVTVARFAHVWHETPDGWRVHRALSFDHRPETD